MKKNLQTLCFALLGLLSLTLITAAQTAFTLRGSVVDETDAVIPGATVTLTGADGKARTVTSGADGAFALPQLATGVYQVTVNFDGFEPYAQSGLQLAANAGPLKVVLKVAQMNIVTNVSAEDPQDTTDPTKNLNATVLDEATIQAIVPDNEEDMQTFLQGLAGGQNAQVYVDGFTGGRLPPREAIMQIRVNQNPFTAEFSQPGMGRVEIVTKPGRDQWRGSVGFNFRNSAVDARNAFAVTKPDLNQNRFQFNLSGPIIAKKMSFFANAERRTLEGSNNVVARTLDGTFTANVNAPNTSTFFNLRTDYLLNDKNTLNVSYNRFGNSSINREFAARFGGGGFGGPGGGGGNGGGGGFGGGVSGTSYLLPERGSNADSTNNTLQVGETMIINPKLIMETRVRFIRESRNTTADTTAVAINVLDAFNGGGATCCPSTTKENNLEWQQYLTWTQKAHTIKGGTQLMRYSINDNTASNFNGTYTFSSLDLYRQVINGERDANGNLIRPTQFTISQGDPRLQFTQLQGASFIQDDWRVKPNLTLSLGLRHEFQSQLGDANNFAPRIGIAWSPGKSRTTTVRIGGGIFYSRLTDNVYSNVLRYDGTRQQSFVINNPAWPNAFAEDATITTARTIRRVLDSQLAAPYSVNFNASVERQLPLGFVATTTFMFNRGIHQFRSRNINAPLNGVRPDATQGNIYQIESSALSQSQGLMFGLQRRMGKTFQVFSNYTLSRTMSDSDSALGVPMNNYDLSSEWGRSAMDRRHTLFVGGSINLPKGIRLSPFVTASSGSPFNITTGKENNGDTEINDRPFGLSRNGNLLPSLYSLLTPAMQSYLTTYYPNGVNANGPGAFNVNMSVAKTFSFGERKNANAAAADQSGGPRGGGMRGGPGGPGGGMFGGGNETGRFNLSLSAQITNVLNRVNYGAYSGVLSSPYFGQANSASGARQLEIGLRFSF
ncbi:MAG: hypothetical protein HOP19_26215 [Acidobacteria bacterium]|nr:hypothetical protein [Acidobacteriota bacterium]